MQKSKKCATFPSAHFPCPTKFASIVETANSRTLHTSRALFEAVGSSELGNLIIWPGVCGMPSGGSHPKYSEQVRLLIESNLNVGVRPIDIAKRLQVSPAFVSRLRSNISLFGDVSPPPLSVQGRPRKIHSEAEEGILDFLDEYPTARADEVCDFLSDEFNIEVSTWTARRVLKRLCLSHKKVEHVRTEQDAALQSAYLGRMTQYSVDQIVCLDESAANERTKDRKYGWSPKGKPCRVRTPGRRSKRWSILPALGINGFLHFEVYHGSYNTDRFNDFVERLLEKMNPFPLPRSVLVLDNARIHHSDELQAMCAAKGVRIEYLPPYSPHLNPIELSFNELKAWMKKERETAYEFGVWYEGFITLGMKQICPPEMARSYFRHCMWSVDDQEYDVDYSSL